MKRFVLALFPALLMLALTVMPVGAGVQWCRTDPIVAFNGAEVNLWLSIPQEWESSVTGPAEFTVSVPSDVTREVVFMDAGLNGLGESVTFVDTAAVNGGTIRVDVHVDVPLTVDSDPEIDIPMLLTIELPNGSELEFAGSSQGGVDGAFRLAGSSSN
jgi:hypothetical protein